MARIFGTFKQEYGGWHVTPEVDAFTARTNTFDIIEALDYLEVEVYHDREFTLANSMLEAIGVKTE